MPPVTAEETSSDVEGTVMLMVNDRLEAGTGEKKGAFETTNRVMQWVYKIPVIGWGLEGVLVDPRPKARLAGAFVLIGGPLSAVLLMGWWGAFLPIVTLAALSVVAMALVLET